MNRSRSARRRVLAVLMAFVMAFSVLPAPTWASDSTESETAEQEKETKAAETSAAETSLAETDAPPVQTESQAEMNAAEPGDQTQTEPAEPESKTTAETAESGSGEQAETAESESEMQTGTAEPESETQTETAESESEAQTEGESELETAESESETLAEGESESESAQTEEEQPGTSVSFNCTASDGVKVTAVVKAGSGIPEDAELHADKLEEGSATYDEAVEKARKQLNLADNQVLYYIPYDVYFLGDDNTRYEPKKGSVEVSMKFASDPFADVYAGSSQTQNISTFAMIDAPTENPDTEETVETSEKFILHVRDDGTVEKITPSTASESGFTFDVSSFSVMGPAMVMSYSEPGIAPIAVGDESSGNLTVTKKVETTGYEGLNTEGVKSDRWKWHFKVEISDSSYKDDINGPYDGGMVFKNGVAEFDLGNGESMTANGLKWKGNDISDPENLQYTVTETDPKGCTTSWSGDVGLDGKGSINNGGAKKVTCTNTIEMSSGNLTIKKEVTGAAEKNYKEKEFEFTVTLDPPYNVGEFENGVATFKLKDGEHKTFEKIPTGVNENQRTTYKVEEKTTGFNTTYKVDGEPYPSVPTGEIGVGGDIQVVYENNKEDIGNLIVKKTVTGGGDKTKEWNFTVTLSDREINGQRDDGPNGMNFENGVAKFKLKDGETKEAKGLPAGITYTVEEEGANTDGYTTTSTGATGTIPEDDTARAEFTNDRRTGNLVIKKDIYGNATNSEDTFEFTVQLTSPYGGVYPATYKGTLSTNDVPETEPTEVSFDKEGKADVTLKGGQSLTVSGIPTGKEGEEQTHYTVTEKDNTKGYVVSSKEQKGDIGGGDNVVTFENSKTEPHKTETEINGEGTTPVAGNTYPSVKVGDVITYKITYENPTDKKMDITITDTLDLGLDFVSALGGTYGGYTVSEGKYDNTTRTVTWELKNVQPHTVKNDTESKDPHVILKVKVNAEAVKDDKKVINTAFVMYGKKPKEKTETVENPVQTGGLTVTKTVTGNAGDKTNKAWNFTVTLQDSNGKADTSINGFFGDSGTGMEFKGGVASFTLKHGEFRTATDLPAGITYTVTELEANKDGYTMSSEGATGTITKDSTVEAKFTNSKFNPGSLTVTKTVEKGTAYGGEINQGLKWAFKVELSDTTINGLYGDNKDSGMTFKDGVATFELENGHSRTANNLPKGITYTVTETTEAEGYTTTWIGKTGEITEDGTASVQCTNTIDMSSGNLVIKKDIYGNAANPADEFKFTVKLTSPCYGVYPATYKGTLSGNGTTETKDVSFNAEGEADVTLKGGQSLTVSGIPTGKTTDKQTTYTVTETDKKDYTASSEAQDGSIGSGDNAVTFENSKTEPHKTETEINGKGTDPVDGNTYPSVQVGDVITYKITYENPTDKEMNITIKDKLDEGLTFVSASMKDLTLQANDSSPASDGSGNKIEFAGDTVTWTLAKVPAHTVKEEGVDPCVILKAKVNAEAVKDDKKVENTAHVEYSNGWEKDTETIKNPVETGNLTVTKTVAGGAGDTDKEWHFTVTLGDNTINGKYGDMTFANGVCNDLVVKHGETKTAKDLPAGVSYEVTESEANQDGYTTSSVGKTGAIPANGTAAATFTNSKFKPGSLTVTKTVEKGTAYGGEINKDLKWAFEVRLDDETITGVYGTDEANGMTFKNGVAKFNLKNGQTRTATGLPAGVHYEVTETTTAEGYTTTWSGNTGEITEDGTASVQCTNTIDMSSGDLVIKKDIYGNAANSEDTFEFTVQLTSPCYGVYPATYKGTLSTNDVPETEPTEVSFDEEGKADVTLKGGQSLTVSGIPTGKTADKQTHYTVTEKENTKDYIVSSKEQEGDIDGSGNVVTFENSKTEPHKTENAINDEETAPVNGNTYPSVKVGDVITYEIHYENPTDKEMDITIKDTLDTGLDYVEASAGTHDGEAEITHEGSPATVIWTLKGVKAHTVKDGKNDPHVILKVKVNENAVKKVENTAYVQYGNDPKSTKNTETVENPVVGDLTVTKTVTGNAGNKTKGWNFTVTLQDDSGVTDTSITGTYGTGDTSMEFKEGVAHFTLKDGESKTATNLPGGIKYTVTEEGETKDGVTEDGYTVNKTGDTGTIVKDAKADFTNSKTEPHKTETEINSEPTAPEPEGGNTYPSVKVGDVITYKITYENPTDKEMNITIRDTLDLGLDFVSALGGTYGGYTVSEGKYDNTTRTVTWTLENVPAHTVKDEAAGKDPYVVLKVKVNVDAIKDDKTVTNTAYVGYGTEPNVQTEVIDNPVETGSLTVSKTVTGNAGDTEKDWNFTVTLKNADGTTNESIKGLYGDSTTGMEFDKGVAKFTLKHGESRTATDLPAGIGYEVTESEADKDGYMTFSDGAKGTIPEDDTAEAKFTNTRSTSEKTETSPGPDTAVKVGDVITYQISYENAGTEPIDIIITDVLDKGLDFVSAPVVSGSGKDTYESPAGVLSGDGKIVTWKLTGVPANTTGRYVELHAMVNSDAVKQVKNEAKVDYNNVYDVKTEPVENPVVGDLTVTKTVTGNAGDKTKEWSFTVTLQDDAGKTDTSINGTYGVDGTSMTFEEGVAHFMLKNGEYKTATNLPGGIKYTVTEEGETKDGVTEDGYTVSKTGDTGKIVKEAKADFTNSKSEPHKTETEINGKFTAPETEGGNTYPSVKVGDVITYKITYENPTDKEMNITITDALDARLDFVSAPGGTYGGYTVSGGSYDSETRTVTWTLGKVQPYTVKNDAESKDPHVVLNVRVNASAMEKVENTAKVKFGNNPAVDTETIENPLETGGLKVSKIVTGNAGETNKAWEFTVTLKEKVTDPSPARIDGTYGDMTFTNGVATFTLKSGESKMAEDLPAGLTYTVVETDEGRYGYKTGKTGDTGTIPADGMAEAVFTNDRKVPNKTETIPGPDKGVQIGDEITYLISYDNPGAAPAKIVITDQLDPGVDFVSAPAGTDARYKSPEGVYDPASHTVTWTLENMPAETTEPLFVELTVRVNNKALKIVDNKAVVEYDNSSSVETDTVENPVVGDLIVKKTVIPASGEEVDTEKEFYFTVKVTDDGKPVEDGTYGDMTFKGGVAEFTLKGGESVKATGLPDQSDYAVSEAEANKDGYFTEVTGASGTITADKDNVATAEFKNIELKPHKTEETPGANTCVEVGKEITYHISYENLSSEPMKIVITDTLDKGLDFVSASDGGDYNELTRTVTWTLNDVPAGTTGKYVVLKVKVNENAVEKVENTAFVQFGDTPKVQTETITNPMTGSLKVTKKVDALIGKDGKGKGDRTKDWHFRVELSDTMINGTYGEGNTSITFKDGVAEFTLKDGESKTATGLPVGTTYTVTEAEAGKDGYTTKAAGDTGSIIQDKTVEAVFYNDLLIPNKTELDPGDDEGVRIGQEITYQISYNNPDSENPAKVTITDKLDPGVDFVSASDGGVYEGTSHTVTWTIPEVEANTPIAFVTLTVKVNSSAGSSVKNTAKVQIGNNPEVMTETVENPVPHKTSDPVSGTVVTVGRDILYTITYQNTKDVAADIKIKDTLDRGLTIKESTISDGGVWTAGPAGSGGTINWTLENVSAHKKGEVTFVATVNEKALTNPGKKVVNTAYVDFGNGYIQTETVEHPVPEEEPHKTETTPGDDLGVKIGDKITYEISYKNPESKPADIIIRDPLDPGLDFVSASDGGKHNAGTHEVTWTLKDVEAGASGAVTLTVRVNANAITKVENTAYVKFGDNPEVKTETVENPIPHKTSDPVSGTPVVVGGDILYTITYRNTKDAAATIKIKDTLDRGLTIKGGSISDGGVWTAPADADVDGGTINWTLENVPAGTEGFVTFIATVNEKALTNEGRKVVNTAYVDFGNGWIQTEIVEHPVPEEEPHKTEVTPGDDLGVKIGGEITYEISYENPESDPANIIIRDPLDPGLDFVSASDGGAYNAGTRTVTWTLKDVAAGTSGKVTLTVRVNAEAETKVENTAYVKYGNNPEVKTETVENPVPHKTSDPVSGTQVVVGGEIKYTITYRNTKDAAATIKIKDTLDRGLTIKRGSISDGGEWTAPADANVDGGTINWTLENVPAGTEGSVTFIATVNEKALENPGQKVENTAYVDFGNGWIQTETVEHPVPEEGPHKTEVTPGDDLGVKIGDKITYEISYENPESEPVKVVITDPLDQGLDFVSAPDGGVYDIDTRTVTWTLKDVAAGASGKVTLTVRVNTNAVTKVENTAYVKFGNKPEVKTETVENPIPHKTSDPVSGTQVVVGGDILYTITYRNTKDAAATIKIKDTLDRGLTIRESSISDDGVWTAPADADVDGGTINWTLENVPAGAEGFVTFIATVNEKALTNQGKKVVNTAYVDFGNGYIQTEIVEHPVPEEEPHKTEKTPGDDLGVKVGDEITYEISYENPGSEPVKVVITDTLDPGLEFESASDGGVYDAGSRTVTWTFESVAAETTDAVVTLTVKVNTKAETKVENTAYVKYGNKPEVKTETVENPIPHKKSDPVSGTQVVVGGDILYTITYRNTKDAAATIKIKDTLDRGLTIRESSISDGGVWTAPADADVDGGTINWTLENVPAGAEGFVTFIATVNEKALTNPEKKVVNTAYVDFGNGWIQTETVEHPVPEEEPHKTEVTPGDDLGVKLGDEITYEIRYENNGEEAEKIVIEDPLDKGLDFVSASDGGAYDISTRTVTWTFESVAAGASGKVTLTVRVNANAVTKVENTAYVKYGNKPEVKTETVENPVPHKTSDPVSGTAVIVGGEIKYTITYRNTKDAPATIKIRDTLDRGLTIKEGSISDGGVWTAPADADADGGTINWTLKNVPAGAEGFVTFTATVNEKALTNEGRKVVNTAYVDFGNGWIQTETVEHPVPEEEPHKTEVTPGDDLGVKLGDEITYEISYENNGKEAEKIVIEDPLDKGLDFVSASDDGVYDAASHTVTWTFENVEAGVSEKVTLTVKVNAKAETKVENAAYVRFGNNPKVKTETVENPVPHKTSDPVSGTQVIVGGDILYTITYRNTKDGPATISIKDTLDRGLTIKESSISDGGVWTAPADPDADGGTINWTLENVPAGTEGFVTFVATVNEKALTNPEKKVVNTAYVDFGNGYIQTETVEHPVPEDGPHKTEATPGDDFGVRIGDEITYEISYDNPGSEPVKVVITDTLDPGLDIVFASDGGVYDAGSRTVTWTLKSVPAGTSGKVTLTVKVNENAETKVENAAYVRFGNNPEVKTETVENPVPHKKSDPVSGTSVTVGKDILYTITYQNTKDAAATIKIRDTLDRGLTIKRGSISDGGEWTAPADANVDGGTINWTLENVPAGTEGFVTFVATVNEKALTNPGQKVVNTAYVDFGNGYIQTETVEHPVPEEPDEPEEPKEPHKTEVTPGDDLGVKVGDMITYEISYGNPGDEPVKVVITDPLDKGLDFVSASNGGVYDAAGHTVTWTFESVAAGTSGKVTLAVRVNANSGTKVENTATVKFGNNPEVKTETVENPIPHKTSDPVSGTQVVVGGDILYTITYRNTKDAAATIKIRDTLDRGLTIKEGSISDGGVWTAPADADADGGTINWTLENVAAGAEGFVTFIATVNEKALTNEGRKVVNTAYVDFGNGYIQTETVEHPVPEEEPHKTEVTPGDDLGVKVGDEITYEISYDNPGDEPVKVVITDPLDQGLDFVSASDGGVYDAAGHTVTWTFESVASGTSGKVTLAVRVNAKAVTKVENTAYVRFGSNPEVKTETVENPIPHKKSDPVSGTSVVVGQDIRYTITYKNTKDAPATIKIRDTLDRGLTFKTASDGGVWTEPADPNADGGTINWTLENVPAGAEGFVSFAATVNEKALINPGKKVVNTAYVDFGNGWIQTETVEHPVPDKPEEPHKTEVTPGDDLGVKIGDEITYEISYENKSEEAETIVITDPLDQGLDFVSASDGGAYDAAGHTVTWTFESVAAGTKGKVTLTVRVNANAVTKVENTAYVKYGNNPEMKTETVENPIPHKTSDPVSGTPVTVGQDILYTITYQNTKDAPATIKIRDTLDRGLTIKEGSISNGGVWTAPADANVDGGTISWTLENIPAGAEGFVTFTATVNEKALTNEDRKVENTAYVDFGNGYIQTETVEHPVSERPVVVIEKRQSLNGGRRTKNRLTADAFDVVTYYLTVKNTSNSDATNVVVTDVIPQGLTLKNGDDAISDGGTAEGDVITWNLGTLAANASRTVSFKVVTPRVDKYTLWKNMASVDYKENDGPPKDSNEVEVEEEPADESKTGSVTVTKKLTYNGNPLAAEDATFYVALYADEACTVRVTDLAALRYRMSSCESVTFKNLEVGRNYYVGESDAQGNVILSGMVSDGSVFTVEFAQGSGVNLKKAGDEETVEFENAFMEIPKNFMREGTLTITKQLLGADGQPEAGDETFYAGIFADETYTTLSDTVSENIVALPLGGSQEVSASVQVYYADNESVKLYVTEVSADGTPVGDDFGYTVTITDGEPEFDSANIEKTVTITNQKPDESETEPETEQKTKESESESETEMKATSVQTGDNTPIVPYVLLLLAAAFVLAAAAAGIRKKKTR